MEVYYQREMNHNYLIIEPDTCQGWSYEVKMLLNNSIEGLLKFRMKQVDQNQQFFYEITSKQPLSRLLENRSITAKEIRALLFGIASMLERVELYLLREQGILLEPEYIYVEPAAFEVFFCLVPGRKGEFPQELQKLLYYLLKKADHQDKECVVLVYGLYQASQKENYGMEDLFHVLSAGKDESSEVQKAEPLYEEDKAWEQEASNGKAAVINQPGTSAAKYKYLLIFLITVIAGPMLTWLWKGRGGLEKGKWFLAIADLLAGLVCGICWFNSQKKTDMSAAVKATVMENGSLVEKQTEHWQLDFEQEEQKAEKAEKVPEAEFQTVLLADLEGGEKKKQRRLVSLQGNTEDIPIAYYPYIIGRTDGLADFGLDYPEVSRMHVKFDMEADNYIVTDLNSTNGTKVQENRLNANESCNICTGDTIWIGNLGFKFR